MIKTPLRSWILVPAVAALLSGCAPYVRSDVNRALIGSVHCHTFAWAGSFRGSSPLRGTIANPLNETRLRTAIAAHLSGGVQTQSEGADCLVGYGIGSNLVVDYLGGPPYGPYGWGYPYWGWGWDPYVYREGIIAVDLYDAKSKQPLWHASVEKDLHGANGPEAEKRIDAAVALIFTKYPG